MTSAPDPNRPDPPRRPARPAAPGFQSIDAPRSSLGHLQPPTVLGPGVTDSAIATALRKPAALLVSFPRAGRTWLRVMLAHAFERLFDARSANPLDTDGWARAEPRLPRVLVTHGRGNPRALAPDRLPRSLDWAKGQSVVLLVRDPRDVLVSLYHDRSVRARFFPQAHAFAGSLPDLLRAERGGIRTVVEFYNTWAARRDTPDRLLLVRYEHLLEDTELEFGRVLEFLGLPAEPGFVSELARATSFSQLQRMETSGRLGYKPAPELLTEPNALVMRRGDAGAWRDEFDNEDAAYAGEAIGALDPWYGYSD